jgi:hypothetical protein
MRDAMAAIATLCLISIDSVALICYLTLHSFRAPIWIWFLSERISVRRSEPTIDFEATRAIVSAADHAFDCRLPIKSTGLFDASHSSFEFVCCRPPPARAGLC